MTLPTPRILFVIPYFGEWPFWMPFFLESCRRNADIDWLLFSDCGTPADLPANVRIEAISYSDYCRLVSDRLEIDFAPQQAYKLCDIKPALGYIHADRLEGYDFWAFGDIDLVYGDLRAYFTNERLARRDFFSTHERRVAGHLCLIRNTPCKRALFKRMPNWQARFTDQTHHALDEGAFSRLFLRRKNLPRPLFKLLGQLNPLRRRSDFTEAYSTPNGCIAWHDGRKVFPQRWYWRDGRLSNDLDSQRAYPYFHFACWKRNEWRDVPQPDSQQVQQLAATSNWMINDRGFHQDSV
ncbi:hypothetical protein DZC75_01830 [Pseudomonas parafulva]|uniref:Uncharacterized protein n=1 Tax=Pseudomonas parafulva TaxID=157782 RepID=A0AAI8P9Y8_9PSED|nr:DUF6625 family protein [Pseudomonas parafulva]AXO86807.1 hypothetical protein DZC75_01830 [Pseudomonas parafulva]